MPNLKKKDPSRRLPDLQPGVQSSKKQDANLATRPWNLAGKSEALAGMPVPGSSRHPPGSGSSRQPPESGSSRQPPAQDRAYVKWDENEDEFELQLCKSVSIRDRVRMLETIARYKEDKIHLKWDCASVIFFYCLT